MDKRFSKIAKDPRFKKIPRRARKIRIDSRFKRMFTDRKFHTKYFVDKRGKQLKKTSTEDLRKFYEVSDEEKEGIDNEQTAKAPETLKEEDDMVNTKRKLKSPVKKDTLSQKLNTSNSCEDHAEASSKYNNVSVNEIEETKIEEAQEDDSESSDEDEFEFGDIRGEGIKDSSSEDEEESRTKNEIEHDWGNLDGDAKRKEDAETNRLAVCNLDWDRVTANDIFVLFSSFKPAEGTIRFVKIYPSEYGLKRMAEEDISGPQELWPESTEVTGEDSKSLIEGSDYDVEKLRQYQLNRLKYYYAVVECDSKDTADKIYSECDTMEYELSGTRLDLRFIPDDVTFDAEPKSVATDVPNLTNYKPSEFVTSALQQSNVRLTWDEADPKRIQTTMRNFSKDDLLDMDFEAYLASSSDEQDPESATKLNMKDRTGREEGSAGVEESEDCRIAKYRALLREIEDKEKKEDDEEGMEISWNVGLSKAAKKVVEETKQKEEQEQMTPWQKYQKDKKRKKKERAKDLNKEQSEDAADIKGDDPRHSSEANDHVTNDDEDEDEEEEQELTNRFKDDPFFKYDSEDDTKKRNHKRQKKRIKHKEEDLTEEEKIKQQRKKEELELILMDDQEEKQHFNFKSILEKESKTKKKKRKKDSLDTEEQKDNFEIDVKDPRFNALFTSHHFAIDPSDQQYRKTKAMDTIIEEKQKRREENVLPSLSQRPQETKGKEKKLDPSSLSALVKTVKSKTEQFHQKKKRKLKVS